MLSWLIRKRVSCLWSEDCETSFLDLKTQVTSGLVLTLPLRIEVFSMYIDALSVSLGAVLMQHDQVVTYTSRKLKSHEVNYHTYDLEFVGGGNNVKELAPLLVWSEV